MSKDASLARRAEATALLSQGVKVVEMATRWGLTEGAVRAYLRRLKTPGKQYRVTASRQSEHYGKMKMYGNEPEWQKADPSTLTAEQLDHAMRLDIPPARYAWLLLCPRGGNAGGNKADRSLR
ncbi:MAG TPA: hypothetical protein VLA31_06950 [Burkholderiaceae bacterium]|nr:hypothetical protein [Burkholderiaceae bacterium]